MMQTNIQQYRLIKALEGASQSFFATSYVLFLKSFGLNTLQINMINFLYMLVSTVMDPITGYLGDRFGHVRIYKLGYIFYIIAEFVYFLSGSMYGFLIAESFAALGYAFKSEAMESWLRNDIGEKAFDKVKSKVKSIAKVAGLVTAVCGSILAAHLGLQYPWLAGGIFSIFVLAYLVLFFKGESKSVVNHKQQGINLVGSIKNFWRIKELRVFILVALVTNLCFQPFNMFWTLIFVSRGADQIFLGVVWIGVALSLMSGYEIIHRLQNRNTAMMGFTISLLALFILLSVLSQSLILTVIFFCLHEVMRPILEELSDTLRNRFIEPELRSTYNSMMGSMKTIGACIGLLLSGLAGLVVNESVVWMIFVIPLLILGIIVSFKKENSLM